MRKTPFVLWASLKRRQSARKARARCLALLLCGFLSASDAFAPNGWWRTYGGSSYGVGNSVQQTSDYGYIIAGVTYGVKAHAVYLIKTDGGGDTLWTRTWDGLWRDAGYSVQQTTDGGYVVAGTTEWYPRAGGGATDVYLIRTNAQGDALWTQSYGGYYWEEGSCVRQTADAGYIIAGRTSSYGRGAPDCDNVYLIKTDAQGDTLWTRAYGWTIEDGGYSVQQTSDGGYIVTGYAQSPDERGVWLIKTDAQGDTLWTKTYGSKQGAGYSVQQTTDGGYVVAGRTDSYTLAGGGADDVYLIKTNAQGDTLWTRTYGGTDDDVGKSVQQTAEGGYIITGYTRSLGAGMTDVYLIKTNAQGDTLWTRTYGGTDTDVGKSVQQTAEGGYIITGETFSFVEGSHPNVYLIKTDSVGNVGVGEEHPRPQAADRRLAATVARSLPHDAASFDAMGRRCMRRQPGIYFVRTSATTAPRKVLLVE